MGWMLSAWLARTCAASRAPSATRRCLNAFSRSSIRRLSMSRSRLVAATRASSSMSCPTCSAGSVRGMPLAPVQGNTVCHLTQHHAACIFDDVREQGSCLSWLAQLHVPHQLAWACARPSQMTGAHLLTLQISASRHAMLRLMPLPACMLCMTALLLLMTMDPGVA